LISKFLHTTSLKANIAANFIGNGWSAIIGLIFVPIYLKYIGAEGYGLIGIFASLQVVLSLLDSGLSTTLNKEMASLSVLPNTEHKMRNLVKTLGTVYWVVAFIAGFIAVSISPLLAKFWVQPKELSIQTITFSFILLSFSLAFQLLSGFYSGGLLGLQKQVMLNTIRIVFSSIKSVGAALILIFITKSLLIFFGWNLLMTVIQALTLRFSLWYYLPGSEKAAVFDKQELKNIQRFAAGMFAISVTAVLLSQVDKIILSKILSLEQFGYYSLACSLGLVIFQIITPLSQSYFPKFSNLVSMNKFEELKTMYHQACQMISVMVLPAALILVFFSHELIFIWTKNLVTTENTWLVTAIYAYGTGINGLLNIPYLLTLSFGWTKLGFYQNVLFLIIMIPLTIILAFKFGAVGGAISWATINTLYFLITPHLIHKRILQGETANWYFKDSLLPFIICLIIIVISKYFIVKPNSSSIIELLQIAIVGMAAIIGIIPFSDSLRSNVYKYIIKLKPHAN
jgi:O-antigen/teichoic acid export membrane protein